jgi:endonuclease/exonuclease/phosphatase family metal-dependent hydrolase
MRTLAFVAVALVAGCPPLPPPPPPPPPVAEPGPRTRARQLPDDTITVATFNIQIFGRAKRGKPDVMAVLVDVVRKYDIIAIQEIKEASGETPPAFLEAINADGGPDYAMVVSPPTGATASSSAKEQYAFYFNTETIESLDEGALYPDPADAFVREPWVARFRAAGGSFSFVLLGVHTQPAAAVAEVGALHDAVTWARTRYAGEDDFIALGDFNASCSYASTAALDALALRGAEYSWIVPDDADTNLAASTCAYDRIVVTAATDGDYSGQWGVDQAFTDTTVSDHWPVWAKFYSKRDAGCCRTCTAGKACGDSCISLTATCSAPPGCACDG